MVAMLVLYGLISVFGAKFNFKGTGEYLSIDNTNAVKGIFILMVFFSHCNAYITVSGSFAGAYKAFFDTVGQSMVALFLFYSGYGIMESFKKKGDKYASQIPFKRILGTLFRFDCAIVLFIAVNLICGNMPSLPQVLLSLVAWEAVGNSNWYIFVILILYLFAFIGFKVFKNKAPIWSAALTLVLTAIAVAVADITAIKLSHWYDTALIFPLGMFWSIFRHRAETVFNKNIFVWAAWVMAGMWAYLFLHNISVLSNLFAHIIFTIAFVVFTMRVTFQNRVLKWCGEHLFEIYILQRLPMIMLKNFVPSVAGSALFFILSMGATIPMAIGFKYITNIMWNKIAAK